MFIFIRARRIAVILPMVIAVVFVLIFAPENNDYYSMVWDESVPVNSDLSEEFTNYLEEIIRIRDRAMLENDIEAMRALYNVNTKLGIYAFEHEQKKLTTCTAGLKNRGWSFPT